MSSYFQTVTILGLIFLAACAGTRETVTEEKPSENKKFLYDESFDPRSLDDDDIVIGPAEQIEAGAEGSTIAEKDPETTEDQARLKEVNGFRVQILATNNIETASLVEQEASDRFESNGHKTYLLFETPLYKIRIGDCENRADAEVLRDLAIENGYTGAFIVKSKVVLQP